ncbi:MFS transporter [Parasporobacterium paucivorans]|uniref:MFS transporter, OFA family, oxalate/formate antiporter n=1 Tax=Parasporobacterium paucivorans DSM 15970 TaxID=1122934 RepID=A0A1M6FBN6_9FIRM|nr:MFS transporter [Parasporobacterium paucivorans]SHI95085.1 MFS transporter, OFA family, oxalate/formate antiporter [Parasporobacterium paucivorans DSM 15970]
MRKIMATASSAIIMLLLGLIYAWSIFVAPLEKEFGWTRDQTSLTFTICMSFFCIGGLVAARIRKKINVSILLIINAIVILIGFLLTSRLTSLWQLYVFYGVFCGLSVGSAYNCILSIVPMYYPKRIGIINGSMLFCFGMGGLVLGTVAKKLINIIEWRETFVYLGITFIVVFLALAFFVRTPKNLNAIWSDKKIDSEVRDRSPKEMIRHPYFWIFNIWQIFVSSLGLALIGHSATLATEFNVPGGMIALAVGLVSASNGLGKFAFSTLYDIKGRTFSLTLSSVLGLLGVISLILCFNTGLLPFLVIGYICIGLSYGAAPGSNATFTRKQFGNTYFSTNFAISSFSLLVAAFLGTYLIGMVRAASSNYLSSLMIMGVFTVLAIIFVQFMRKEKA